jgi:O-antigen/teichoic acid export membrane protein
VIPLLRKASPTAWVAIQTTSQQAFSILIFAIQAPMLGPRPFGLVSVVMVLIGFCEFVLGAAAAEALISIRRIEPLHYHTTSLVNLLFSLLCGCLFFAGADQFASLFGDRDLAAVMRVMSVLPVISALSAAPTAATKREMHFKPTAVRGILGVICGGLVGLVMTIAGFGVWALVWQAIVQRLVATVSLWLAVPLPFRLAWSPRHFREMRHFAAMVMLSRSMNWASAQIPRLLLGLFLGTTEVGLFSMAGRLNDIVTLVALEPKVTVARVDLRRYADDRAALEHAALRIFNQLSAVCFPLFIGAAAVVPTLFHAWLDPHWFGGIVPAQLMLLMGVPVLTTYCTTAILLAINRQSSEATVSTVQTGTVVLAVLLTAPLGLIAASTAMAIRPLLLMPLPLAVIRRTCGISPRAVLLAQMPALLSSLAMGAGVLLLGDLLQNHLGQVPLLLLLVMAGAAGYAALLWRMAPELSAQLGRKLFGLGRAHSLGG